MAAAVENSDAATLEREVSALRTGAALSPLAERMVLAARGDDRTTFLQGMLSNDVKLAPGQGTHALLLTEQGKVVADLCVLVLDDVIWLDLPASSRERVRTALERFVVADDVELDELTLSGMALRGPSADAVLASVLGADVAALPEGAHVDVAYGGGHVRVARLAEFGARGFHVWCAEEDCEDALALALLDAGAVSVGPDACEIFRIANGWAREGVDYDAQTLAAEIPSLARAVSYRKGCYLGQEVMERIAARGHVNWLLVRLTGDPGATLVPGAIVRDGHTEVGRVTSVAVLPDSRRPVALARVRASAASAGARLVALDGDRSTAVEVGGTPVVD
jgi:folate-binding protein YgfZ